MAGTLRQSPDQVPPEAAPTAPALDAPLCELLTIWRSLCRGGAIPHRDGVEAMAMTLGLQPYLAVVDIAEGGAKLRFRYCGAKLAEAAGMDLTGHLVHRLNPDRPYAAYIEALYDRAQSTQCPVYSECSYTARRSAATRTTQRLICPLAGGGDRVVAFVAAQTYRDVIDGESGSASPSERPSLVHHDHFVPGRLVVLG